MCEVDIFSLQAWDLHMMCESWQVYNVAVLNLINIFYIIMYRLSYMYWEESSGSYQLMYSCAGVHCLSVTGPHSPNDLTCKHFSRLLFLICLSAVISTIKLKIIFHIQAKINEITFSFYYYLTNKSDSWITCNLIWYSVCVSYTILNLNNQKRQHSILALKKGHHSNKKNYWYNYDVLVQLPP